MIPWYWALILVMIALCAGTELGQWIGRREHRLARRPSSASNGSEKPCP